MQGCRAWGVGVSLHAKPKVVAGDSWGEIAVPVIQLHPDTWPVNIDVGTEKRDIQPGPCSLNPKA